MIRHIAVCDACGKTEPCATRHEDPVTFGRFTRPAYIAPSHWKQAWDLGMFCSWRCLADAASRQEEVADATP